MPPAGHDRFLDLDLPEHFMLQFRTKSGGWMEEAVCLAEHAKRLDDGSYAVGTDGIGIMFRCIEHRDGSFIHVDGGGRRFEYRLLPIPPDGIIELPEGGQLLP